MVAYDIWEEDWHVKYISSIYWSITTMITVGYGDIVPINKNEKLYTMFIMLVASVIFAYSVRPGNIIIISEILEGVYSMA